MADQHIMPVQVSYDESQIRHQKLSQTEIAKRKRAYLSQARTMIGKNDQQKLGLESSIGRDERKQQLLTEFQNGHIFTIKAGAINLNLSEATIKKYAQELNISLFDNKTGTWLTGQKPPSLNDIEQKKH